MPAVAQFIDLGLVNMDCLFFIAFTLGLFVVGLSLKSKSFLLNVSFQLKRLAC